MNPPVLSGSTWVDLIDVGPEDKVLLVDGAQGRAVLALHEATEHLTVVADAASPVTQLPDPPYGGWDVVCLDGVDVARPLRAELATRLSPRGRVVMIADNRWSPLRLIDGLLRGARGPGARWGHRRSARDLRAAGLAPIQTFGLLRTTDAPVVAFDARATSSMAAVLGSTTTHVQGWRGRALAVAARIPARVVLTMCAGWLLVTAASEVPDPDRVVGKVSNRDSHEVKLLRGDPVSSIEKRYDVVPDSHELAALRELEAVGFSLSPRVIDVPGARVQRQTWLGGRALSVDRLSEDELVAWVARTADVLAELQRLTRHPDGSVLVHGDLWLGNLLVEGRRIVGVVDWADSYRGPDRVDRDFLVDSLADWGDIERVRPRLEAARDRAFSAELSADGGA